jgi:Pyruvate phosphate dikinase, AMP/ATP-binding domain
LSGCRSFARESIPIPDDPRAQLRDAIKAVFRSSRSERARVYAGARALAMRCQQRLSYRPWPSAISAGSSGTGVAFSRNPSTGANEVYGDFLANAQGEDVVAGIRASLPLGAMRVHLPEVHDQLCGILRRLERHYRDLCDVEFTVQDGLLQILQVRAGKRSAIAAARIAVALANEGCIDRGEAVRRMTPDELRQLKSVARLREGVVPIASGVAASPGVVSGLICVELDRVAALAEGGRNVILVRPTIARRCAWPGAGLRDYHGDWRHGEPCHLARAARLCDRRAGCKRACGRDRGGQSSSRCLARELRRQGTGRTACDAGRPCLAVGSVEGGADRSAGTSASWRSMRHSSSW